MPISIPIYEGGTLFGNTIETVQNNVITSGVAWQQPNIPFNPVPNPPTPPPITGEQTVLTQFNQVAGLVPMFQDCETKDSKVKFSITISTMQNCVINGVTKPNIFFQLKIGGITTITITIAIDEGSSSTIEDAINAAISAQPYLSGFTAHCVHSLVSGNGVFSNSELVGGFSIMITSPEDSGSDYNGTQFEVVKINSPYSNCYEVISENEFSGGVTIQNACIVGCDKRSGLNIGDIIPDDKDFSLLVLADEICTSPNAPMAGNAVQTNKNNDTNTWLFEVGNHYTDDVLHLQKLNTTTNEFETIADLDSSNSYGIFLQYKTYTFSYQGYTLEWLSVYAAFGEGTYRVVLNYSENGFNYSGHTPPFCLKKYSPYVADMTVRFDCFNYGGNIGNVNKQGEKWRLSGTQLDIENNFDEIGEIDIELFDSIRIGGMFKDEAPTIENVEIKFPNGFRKQIRQETIKNFSLNSSPIPMWLIQRLFAYCFMADECIVYDFNIGNPNYNLKGLYVRIDGEVSSSYNIGIRYEKLTNVKFKEQQQFIFRNLA